MIKIHIVSPTTGSIGEITRELVDSLKKDQDFLITEEQKGDEPKELDILLCHFLDKRIVNSEIFKKFRKKILIQPIDGTKLKKEYVELLNKFDLIICPALASKKILLQNDVKTEIEVISNYYKENIFEKPITTKIEKELPKDRIIFYHESTFHPRKGIDLLYESYIRAFSDTSYVNDVLLVLKDSNFNSKTFDNISNLKKLALDLQKKYKKPARILKFSSSLKEEDLKTLWNCCHGYVSFARIEGFGIPMLRHMLLKKPILTLQNNYSGYNDYLSEENSYFVETVQTIANKEFMEMYDKETKWASANIADLVDSFRNVYTDLLSNKQKKIKSINQYKDLSFNSVLNAYKQVLKNI